MVFTTALGLQIWIQTLRLRAEFAPRFSAQPDPVKSLMQVEVGLSSLPDQHPTT